MGQTKEKLSIGNRKWIKKADYRKNPSNPQAKKLTFVTFDSDVHVNLHDFPAPYFFDKEFLAQWDLYVS